MNSVPIAGSEQRAPDSLFRTGVLGFDGLHYPSALRWSSRVWHLKKARRMVQGRRAVFAEATCPPQASTVGIGIGTLFWFPFSHTERFNSWAVPGSSSALSARLKEVRAHV